MGKTHLVTVQLASPIDRKLTHSPTLNEVEKILSNLKLGKATEP